MGDINHCTDMVRLSSNDSLFYNAVEPDSCIAVLWHFLSFSSFDCL